MAAAPSELARLLDQHPAASVTEQADGSAVVHVPARPLPLGWSKRATDVRWLLSPGYPAAQPDCFFADSDLALSGGALPVNSGLQPIAGQTLLWFSWHLTNWRPGRDNLITYLRFVEKRLADAR